MNENINFSDINILVNNLMDNQTKEKYKTEDSVKRENIISQVLKDEFDLEINNESNIFLRERIIAYLEVIISKKSTYEEIIKDPIERKRFLINKDSKPLVISINKKNYEIGFSKFYYIKCGQKYCKPYEKERSTNENENNSTSSKKSKKSVTLSNPYVPKIFEDEDSNDFIMIIQREVELDGSFISKKEISDLKKLKDIIFYPKDVNDIKIANDERIIIEIKQNATLKAICNQMRKNITLISEIIPNKKFYYFGFVKDTNYKKDENNNTIDENQLIEEIKNEMNGIQNIQLFLCVINNNQLFGIDLEEQLNYGVHFYNLIKKEIDGMKKKIGDVENKIGSVEERIGNVENKIGSVEERIGIVENKIGSVEERIWGVEKKIENIGVILHEISSDLKNQKYSNSSRYFNRNNNNFYHNRANFRRGNGYNNRKKKYYYNIKQSYYY